MKAWLAIDHESLIAQSPYYTQLVEDSRRVWEQIKALYDKGLKGGEAEKEAQTREQFFLASKLLAEHEVALAASNEVLRVGRASNAPDLYVRTHAVDDLLNHPDGDAKRQLELLRDMIQRMVAPDSWHETDGQGSVTMYQDRCLIISQTQAVHEQITKFLEHLRSLRKTPTEAAEKVKP